MLFRSYYILEQKELSLEKEETFKYSTAQEYNTLFTEFSSLNPSIPGLQEDDTTKYDESSSSDNEEDEGEKKYKTILLWIYHLPKKKLLLSLITTCHLKNLNLY